MVIYTAQMARGKKDPDFFDVSIKSGNRIFAPTWNMVMSYKNGTMTEAEYATLYRELMLFSFRNHQEQWEELFQRERVVLTCYCKAGDFCHRRLLAEYLTKAAYAVGEDVVYKGELL